MPPETHAQNLPLLLGDCAANSRSKFWNFVKKEICRDDKRPTRAQELVCQLPFELFVTLNYDRLLEGPWSDATGLDQSNVMAFPGLEPGKLSGQRLVYLHGRCPGAGKQMSNTTTVLTQNGYYQAYGGHTPLSLTVGSLFTSLNVLIIGSSLADPELAHILTELGRADHLRGSPAKHRRVAFVATPQQRYTPGLEYTFGGMSQAIHPLFYHSPDGKDHSNLDRALQSLARLM